MHTPPWEGFLQHPGKGSLHYIDWGGSGPCAHLLHANGFCAGTYAPLVRLLTPFLHVHGSDIRGHGDSNVPKPERITDWHLFSEDLQLLVDQVLEPPIIGMGHSLGAVATFLAAARRPDLFSALVLMDPVFLSKPLLALMGLLRFFGLSGRIPLARGARRRKRQFADKQEALARFTAGHGIFKSWEPEFIDAYMECGFLEKPESGAVLKCDPELEAQIFESVPGVIWEVAGRISIPVLILRGAASDALFPGPARQMTERLTNATLIEIPDSGHFLPMEQPEACADAIRSFLFRHFPEEFAVTT